jgi:ribonuclease-3
VTGSTTWCSRQLGYEFSDPALLEQALTHRSRSASNNERLEFLGDAVLSMVIAEALHEQEQGADEGTLTRLRAMLVSGDSLATVAASIGVGDRLRLGAGEQRSGGHQRKSLMADALEAIYGAVYLDGGYGAARAVIRKHFQDRLAGLPEPDALKDPKTLLQERLQASGDNLPQYVVTRESGPPHARFFQVSCLLAELGLSAAGSGSSRRRAEQQAAEAMLVRLEEHHEQAS